MEAVSGYFEMRNEWFTYLESINHQFNCHVAFLIGHFLADAQKHQHGITLSDSHGVDIAKNIATSNSTLKSKVKKRKVKKQKHDYSKEKNDN